MPDHLREEQIDLGMNVGVDASYPFSKQNPFLDGDLVHISSSNPADAILALEALLQVCRSLYI